MTLLRDKLDDATRSRLAALNQRRGGGQLNLYALFDRSMTVCLVVVANGAEQALDLAHGAGMRDWTLGNVTCRSIVRNVQEDEAKIITAVSMARN